jgi:hypothetical protein
MTFKMQDYTAEVFLPYVGQVLLFEPPADEQGDSADGFSLELLEVRQPRTHNRPDGFRQPFTLLFALRGSRPLGPGCHRIAHHDFEPSEWLLTRVVVPQRDPGIAYYEAVFG